MQEFDSIANKLMRHVLQWILICILSLSALRGWLDYRAIREANQKSVSDIVNTHLPLLGVAVWDIEPEAITKQLRLISSDGHIVWVSLRTSTGQVFKDGDDRFANDQKLTLKIPAPQEGFGVIEELELVVDQTAIYWQIWRSVLMTFLEIVVLASALSLAIARVLRRDLERPMHKLANFVRNLQADQLATEFPRKPRDTHIFNEIDLVIEGFRSMQDSLRKHIAGQDQLVAERTQQLQKALTELEKLSTTDSLTQVSNRLHFDRQIQIEWQRAQRYQRNLSVIFCDIDYFKQVNDRHGHASGDLVLVRFAACLQNELRAELDWLARYGGEEFVVVLPETSLDQAILVAERMRRQVERQPQITMKNSKQIQVSASFGVAELKVDETIASLLQRADSCLYQAKAAGRNQVQPAAEGLHVVASRDHH